ncbi:hypothetical protein BU26DRAFT_604003 [Trematosphaeria pertusa]|uniref:N-acetyltransferase domain-containing protein n=1 Tax=Trematosphaeria pertusa TaxID=390896 RepID=A0A6A6IJB3_9PLEO|nr:uncharacterized protein BU26DRAFT_604003 [Trematosphaeria pertusa]KAF2249660.1 hypothetical protein BU26DRAFT_604003 [Trematosphaeria pertusa]
MATPILTMPILLSPTDLNANPKLTNHIAVLANAAFTRSQEADPEKWYLPSIRFPDTQSLLDMLGPRGVMAVMLDEAHVEGEEVPFVEAVDGDGQVRKGRLVACAAAVPWRGGWSKEGAQTEKGWEIKAVCVDGDARFLKRGLAVKLLGSLEECLVGKEREALRQSALDGASCGSGDGRRKGVLSLWILAAECINGAYWRKRGYEAVRKSVHSGIWSCKTSFEMVVLRRDVEFEM